MKQGTGKTTVSGGKVEPNSRAVNPEAAAEIGLQKTHIKSVPMYEGRGLQAPMVGSTSHKSGSQGKH
jgi:hypothetical protein